ncbi:hypothetical protein GGR53DRAFT_481019 [Hypoxylon sp. FL1150]|nr:hypothetical protein GGR53DRAFT_481019 [Hypoxylon sp. FL1150]
MDFERKARRRLSFHSPTPAPSTPYSSAPRGKLSKYNSNSFESSEEDATPTRRRKRHIRSDSASSVICKHHYHCNCVLHHDRCHYEAPEATAATLKPRPTPKSTPKPMPKPTPTKSILSTPGKSSIPVPSARPPPGWNFQPPSTPGTASNQVQPPINFPGGPQGQAAQFGPLNNLPAWTPPPQLVASPISPVSPGYRSSSMPIFFQQRPSPTPYPEVQPPAHAVPGTSFIPPPPPPLLAPHQPQGSASPFRYSPNEAKKFEEHYNEALGRKAEKKEEKGKDKYRGDQDDDFSKHLQHRHFCAACGAMRSKAYHSKHPLEKGQRPQPGYCHKCEVIAARERDNHKTTEGAIGSSFRDPMLGIKADTDHSGHSNNKGHKKNSRSRGWAEKARRLSVFSTFLPSSTASAGFTQPSETTIASTESEYVPSAPIPLWEAGPDRIGLSAPPGGQAVSHATANTLPAAVDVPSRARGGFPDKHEGQVSETFVQTKTSSSLGKPERQKQRAAAQIQQQTGSSNKANDQTRIPSAAKKPERASKIPRPTNSKNSSEVTSKVSTTAKAPEPSKAARMYHQSQYDDPGPSEPARTHDPSRYKAPVVVDEEDEDVVLPAIPTVRTETSGRIETPVSHVHWGKSRVGEPFSETDQYKPDYENKKKDRDHRHNRKWKRPSPMVPRTTRTEQIPKFPGSAQEERPDHSPTRRHRDDRRRNREAHLRFADEVPLGPMEEPGYTSEWDWTPTPNPFNANTGPIPAFTDDFWGIKPEDAGQAKPRAEDAFAGPDPASTSKPSENLPNSATGFSRVVPSFLSRSEISVESYGSNGGGLGYEGTPSATYRLDEVSETDGETVEGRNHRPFKKLGKRSPGFILGYLAAKFLRPQLTANAEYSSKEDRDRKTARARTHHRNQTSSTHDLRSQARYHRSQSNSASKSSHKNKRIYYPAAEDLKNPRDSSPLAVESSTIAHTGHSAEDLSGEGKSENIPEDNSPTDAGRRRRVRRPSRM